MAENFYTISLPRSRSLWLSMFLHDDNADCYHEALTPFGSTDLPSSQKKYVGSCDTNLLNEVNRRGPTIKIIRPIPEVIDSALKSFDNPFAGKDFKPFIVNWLELNNEKLVAMNCQSYRASDLSDVACLVEIQETLKPGSEFDFNRAANLIDTGIKTMNRDLVLSIKHTASTLNLTVDELYDRTVGVK